MSNRPEIHNVFWFFIIVEVLGMPAELFLKVRYAIKNGYAWRWK